MFSPEVGGFSSGRYHRRGVSKSHAFIDRTLTTRPWEASIMVRLPRVLPSLTLAVLLAAPLSPRFARADDAPATPAPAAPAPAAPAAGDTATPPAAPAPAAGDASAPAPAPAATPAPADAVSGEQMSLNDLVDTYWHYGKIGRYDIAADNGNKILSGGADAPAILTAFEATAAKHNDVLDKWVLRWRALPQISDDAVKANPGLAADKAAIDSMKDVTAKLIDKINQGYEARRSDPQYMHDTIVAMSKGARGYDNNLPRLQKSGELGVKVMIDMLRNPSERQYNNTVREALRALGRKALNPLLAATEMKDPVVLVDVIAALGDIGYKDAVPYLSRLANNPDSPDAVKNAATAALLHMGAGNAAAMKPADQYFDLGEKFYYGNADVPASADKTSYVWYWSETDGLTKTDIPSPIFNDVMAMRSSEYSLKLDPSKSDSVSLWLAADTKREVDLPAGAEDPSHKGNPDAHYYNVSAGVKYLNDALARAIRDRNTGVALKLTQSLQDIIGQSNMAGPNDPVTQALFFPNRLVRYEAAFALAESLPTKTFNGAERVVPLLAEALSQSSKPNVLLLAPSTNSTINTIQDAITSLGYPVVAASDPVGAINGSQTLPSVDVIVISDDSDVQQMLDQAGQNPRLQGASVLVLTHTASNPFAVRAATDPLMNSVVMPPKDQLAATLKAEIDKARDHAGGVALTDAQASDYGLRAADLLARLAISRGQILDLSVAENPALGALSDPRPEIAKAAGRALAMFNSKTAQNGLAAKAADESTPADVRVSLFKSVATSAKFHGNQLDSQNTAALEKIVNESKNADVRGAAAEARGALNLPADEARTLIVGQSKI
jgi:HEAT repeat protein